MTRATPVLGPLSKLPHHIGGRAFGPTYVSACSKPNIRRIFSGIGFRAWGPPASKSRPYHLATAASNSNRSKVVCYRVKHFRHSLRI
ncbi:hypothetical protein AVEN_229020-1 [Araneus ventricosus]|uniref:Uncharacterized protein n=1 Tax=Araneus ventricosus TaxID=182803 RepID=A0A4Y2KMU2_ARAVE|nr:hypothetical protein AVEN_229020-1 [Araneus ventricosus]